MEIGHESRSNLTFCFIIHRDIVIAMLHKVILSLRFENYQFIPVPSKSFKIFNDERDGVIDVKRSDRECSTRRNVGKNFPIRFIHETKRKIFIFEKG